EAGLHLLDRQLIDKDGRLAGKVDDLELELPSGGGPPVGPALLPGPGAPRPGLLRPGQADRERGRAERGQGRAGDQPAGGLDPRPPHRPPPRSRRWARGIGSAPRSSTRPAAAPATSTTSAWSRTAPWSAPSGPACGWTG